MRMLNAYTFEPDDAEAAVSEIIGQLDLDNSLLANSAGFITCAYDYVESGVVKAICDALPFEIIGCTTLTNATNGQAGTMLLCLSVLTADDAEFSVTCTAPLTDNLQQAASETFYFAAEQLSGDPKLVLTFLPMIGTIGGELILDALNDAVGSVPVFGTIACDFDTALYSNSLTIYNGECMRDRMPMMLISGAIEPRFVVTSTSEQNLQKQQAIITASEGSILKEVNGISASDYFNSIGLIHGNGIEGLSSVPFVVNYNDGTQPLARAIYSLNEDGSAVCGGVMPEGGTLSIGRMDVDDILLTADQSASRLLEEDDVSCIIMFPCLGRNMVLGTEPLVEIERVKKIIGNAVPWHLAYSGGEVCPVCGNCGFVNRFHNFTFIACAL